MTRALVVIAALAAACSPVVDVVDTPPCATPVPSPNALPETLEETGVVCDDGALNPEARSFAPRHPLWTDGYEKERTLLLPEGGRILANADGSWELPVGARLTKSVYVDGEMIETRVAWNTASGWKLGSYVWNDGRATLGATPQIEGYEIPQCNLCHGQEPAPLGFNGWQLAGNEIGISTEGLLSDDILRGPNANEDARYALPGDEVIRAGLGYLAANCGSCHRTGGFMEGLDLRLAMTWPLATDVEDSPFFRTSVSQDAQTRDGVLIVPGSPEESVLFQRFTAIDDDRMPPIGTHIIDPDGVEILRAMILALGES